MKIYRTYSSEETRRFGAELAKRVSGVRYQMLGKKKGALVPRQTRDKCALILALKGDLGAGKTTFVQGFLRGLGVRGRVNSPTFVLMKRFALRHLRFAFAYHIDCYRIKKTQELLDLGLRGILTDSRNIVLIEWPEKMGRYLPKGILKITMRHGRKENERVIINR